MGFFQTLYKKIAIEEELAEVSLGKFVKVPDYSEKLGFIHYVVKDLELVFETIPKDYQKLVIFKDDLDRCSPTKVAQVIEGVNLFLAREFPGCIFIIGMDAEMVAAALEVAHKDVISNLPTYSMDIPIGWRFMDKFVQLVFLCRRIHMLLIPFIFILWSIRNCLVNIQISYHMLDVVTFI